MEIKPSDIAKIAICYPPLSDQHSIVTRLDALSSQVRQLEENCRKTLAECDALKQALLREVFEGE
jgi:type I restriction enzyme S subunit